MLRRSETRNRFRFNFQKESIRVENPLDGLACPKGTDTISLYDRYNSLRLLGKPIF